MYDVIVVGAGYSGLTAAKKLIDLKKKVLVLEARDRVGGRVFTEIRADGSYLDLGGAWVGPSQDKFYELIKKCNLRTFPTYDTGKSRIWFGKKLKSYKGLIPPLSIGPLLDLDFTIKKINRLSKNINLLLPWKSKNANKWDEMTLATWMEQNMYFKTSKDLFKIACQTIWAAEPCEISFLHALFYIKSGGDLDCLMNIKNGAQQDRVYGGAMKPVLQLAEEMQEHIFLNHIVKAINQEKDKIKVSGDNFEYQTKKVIVAIPPVVQQKITFSPPLSVKRTQLLQRLPMGIVTKTFTIYEKPFWRENGLNGLAVSNNGFTSVIFDNSPEDGSKGILMGFVLANKAKEFSTLNFEERKSSILQSHSKLFGEEANHPLDYIDHSWALEEFSGGCYSAVFPSGVWTSLGEELRKPHFNIHWAGTETSEVWNGYIEGAIRAGERAALEVI